MVVPVAVEDVVDRLRTYQSERGMSDEAMGLKLGVVQSTWTRVRRGELGLGSRVLPSALRLLGLELVELSRDESA